MKENSRKNALINLQSQNIYRPDQWVINHGKTPEMFVMKKTLHVEKLYVQISFYNDMTDII